MADLIREAKELMNRTPLGATRLFRARQDHYLFLVKLSEGKL